MSFHSTLRLVLFSTLFIITSTFIFSQANLGQYYDEAPLRSWNILAPYAAKNAAMGECIFAFDMEDSLSAMHNPAALRRVKRFAVSFNISVNFIELFRYSVVNTGEVIPGVLNTNIDNPIGYFALEHFGINFPFKGGSIALNISEQEDYRRPELRQAYSISTGGSIDAFYKGKLHNANFSFSYPLLKQRLRIGAGFSLLYGKQNNELSLEMEHYLTEVTDMVKDEQKLKGYYLHFGMILNASKDFQMGFALRTPYNKKATSNFYREYSSEYITISQSNFSEDSYHQPLIIGGGIKYQPNLDFTLTADFSFFRWESYRAERFDTLLPREFRNTLKIGIGAEFILRARHIKFISKLPLRIGYIIDPQPGTSPEWNYQYITFGSGFNIKSLSLDIAAQLGKGKADDRSVFNQRVIISFLYDL